VLYIGCRTATGRPFTVLDFDNDCISPTGGCDAVTDGFARTRRWRDGHRRHAVQVR
jgi:hypothetical protein